jgi:hypothetical protein
MEEDEIEEVVDRIPLDSPKSWVSVVAPLFSLLSPNGCLGLKTIPYLTRLGS